MNKVIESSKEGYLISTDSQKVNLDSVHGYLSRDSYWAKNIPREVVRRSIENSICFSILKNGDQVGFARVVTDRATFAYLADVFIVEQERGKGLSKWLMQFIHEHPDLQGLRRWMLGTRDAHALYAAFGWTPIPQEMAGRFMQKHDPGVYDIR